jgi:hypothetical protein
MTPWEWIAANWATLLVGGAVAALAAVAVVYLWKNRKRGGCSSGCGCCPMAGGVPPQKDGGKSEAAPKKILTDGRRLC